MLIKKFFKKAFFYVLFNKKKQGTLTRFSLRENGVRPTVFYKDWQALYLLATSLRSWLQIACWGKAPNPFRTLSEPVKGLNPCNPFLPSATLGVSQAPKWKKPFGSKLLVWVLHCVKGRSLMLPPFGQSAYHLNPLTSFSNQLRFYFKFFGGGRGCGGRATA